MKKNIFFIMLISITPIICSSQECIMEYTTVVNLKSAGYTYTPGGATKYLRVFIHYVQKDDGTGNFNEVDDGLSPANAYNGYEFADYIINYANTLLAGNQAMRLQPFGNVPVYDPGYRYKLSGVFFWKNSSLYNYYSALSTLMNNYGQCTNSAINIFLTSEQGTTGGYAYMGGNAIILFKAYKKYTDSVNNNNNWYNSSTAKLINHEAGHCLNLYHTVFTANTGECCNDCDDFCDDTPTIQQMLDLSEPNPCCWNDSHCSNNFMDYNADMQSITPDQLDVIHDELDNDKNNFLECNYETSSLDICDFGTESESYIAETISILGSCSNQTAVILNGQTVYLTANEVTFYPGFEVQAGGKLNVLINAACN
ncbi:MAG: hypothetical protein L3J11_06015 [Draconibacterium sp.]|nr:hypothetical protein [Draconibacterium sp.]